MLAVTPRVAPVPAMTGSFPVIVITRPKKAGCDPRISRCRGGRLSTEGGGGGGGGL